MVEINLRRSEDKMYEPMRLYCDDKFAINITHNLLQHEKTKHMKVDRHFIKKNR